MPPGLTEAEEFELLSLERERALAGRAHPALETAARIGKGFLKGGMVGVATEGLEMGAKGVEQLAHGVGGAVTDFTGSPAAGTAANVALQAPMMLVGGAGGAAVKAPLRAGAEWLMQSALKPTIKALKNTNNAGPNAERAINTLLDDGINVSRGGMKQMEGMVDDLSGQITEALRNSGATVDRNAIASRLQDVMSRIEKTDLTPQDRLAVVQKVYDQVLTNPHLPRHIPVEQANKIKSAIYQKLKDAYGELGSDAVEAQKALARGAKEEISAAVPGVEKLNAKEAEIINALQMVQHRALIAGNRDMVGIGWLIAHPTQFAAFMADRSPLFKSIIARMVNQTSKNSTALGAAAGAEYSREQQR